MATLAMRRIRTWLVLAPALAGAACSKDSANANEPAVTSMIIAQSDYVVGLGGTLQIGLFAYDARANPVPIEAVEWHSSDPSLVTVDATGSARGVALGGPVTLTASALGRTASTRVIVRPASVTISPALDSVLFGQSVQLTATARDAGGAAVAAGAAAWSVTPSTSAMISPTGLLTAGTSGTFTVTATIAAVAGQLTSGVSSPYDGTWVGTGTNAYGQPQTVRFNVRFGSVGLFLIPDIRTSCGPQVTAQYGVVLGVPVVNDRFTSTVGIGATIGGTFTSASTVAGSYGLIALQPVPCNDVGSSSWLLVSSAYTAAKQ